MELMLLLLLSDGAHRDFPAEGVRDVGVEGLPPSRMDQYVAIGMANEAV